MPLSDLAAALAAATGPDRALDERLAVEVFHPWLATLPRTEIGGWLGELGRIRPPERMTDDVGAILDSIEGKWSGCDWHVTSNGPNAAIAFPPVTGELEIEATAATPALALCLAAVRLAMVEEG